MRRGGLVDWKIPLTSQSLIAILTVQGVLAGLFVLLAPYHSGTIDVRGFAISIGIAAFLRAAQLTNGSWLVKWLSKNNLARVYGLAYLGIWLMLSSSFSLITPYGCAFLAGISMPHQVRELVADSIAGVREALSVFYFTYIGGVLGSCMDGRNLLVCVL